MSIPKIAIWSSGLFLALGTTAMAAQSSRPMMGGGPAMGSGCMMGTGTGQSGCGYGRSAKGLPDLTEAQQAQIAAITKRHQASLTDKLKAADQARDAMRLAMRDPATKGCRYPGHAGPDGRKHDRADPGTPRHQAGVRGRADPGAEEGRVE